MRKFNIVFMVFFVALIAIFVVLAYKMAFPKSFFDSELQKTIDFEIDYRVKYGIDQDKKNILLMFYRIDNVGYLSIFFSVTYDSARFKGFCHYKDAIVIYEGINDSIAGNFLNLKDLIQTQPNIDPKYIGYIHSDPIINYYRISNKRFIKFKPSEEHINELINELIKLNFLIAPPPEPEY